MSENCMNCRFWHWEQDYDEDNESLGRCIRYPPTTVFDGVKIQDYWPDTLDIHWCGEWRKRDSIDETSGTAIP